MKWFIDNDWSWNGLRQPYRIKERHPDLVLIEPHLQVCQVNRKLHNSSWYFILLSSSNRKYPPFPLLSYFSVVVCLSWLYYHILSSITYISRLGPCFHYWCSVYGICKWSDTLWPVGRVRLFADYTISLSSLCRLIWKHWTTKMLVRYMMPSVCLRLRQFSQLSLYSLYGAVCLQLTQFSCDDRENVYFILLSSSNRKYESLTIV